MKEKYGLAHNIKDKTKVITLLTGIMVPIAVVFISIYVVRPNRVLEVLVRDKYSKGPLSGAMVALDNDKHITKNDGLVYFENLKKGIMGYKITKEKYNDYEGNVNISGKSNSLIIDMEMYHDTVNPVGYIDSPPDGSLVGSPVSVSGRAFNLKPNTHLWLVVKPHESNGWWPQTSEIMPKQNKEWSASAELGGRSKEKFDIHLIIADENTNKYFNDYILHGVKTGKYPAIPLPSASRSLTYITVQKK